MSVTLHNICGAANAGLKQYDKAIEAFQKAIEINPDYADAYNNMGIAFQDQGNLRAAVEIFQKAISLNPNYAEAYNNMGVALQEQGKLKEAVEAFSRAVDIKPDFAHAFNNMGNALKDLTFTSPNKYLNDAITALLDRKTSARPRDIATAATSLLKLNPKLQRQIQLKDKSDISKDLPNIIEELSELPLLLKLMVYVHSQTLNWKNFSIS